MKKMIAQIGKFWGSVFVTIFVTSITTITGIAVNQGIGDTNLPSLFLLGANWFYEGIENIFFVLVGFIKSWLFAFLLGVFLTVIFNRLFLSKFEISNTNEGIYSLHDPSHSDVEGLVIMLRRMSDWARVGFRDEYSFGDETWFIDREIEIEACIDYLSAIGVFMPVEFKSLKRGETLQNAIPHYTRIAKRLELRQFSKVRREYPKPIEVQ